MNSGCSLSSGSAGTVEHWPPSAHATSDRVPAACEPAAGAPVHDHILHAGARGHGFVHGLFQVHLGAAPEAAILRDDGARFASVMRSTSALRRETSEHNRMYGPDARACQHGDGQLRDHAHVDRHPVALLHAQRLKHVARTAALRSAVVGRSGCVPRPARPPIRSPLYCAARSARAGPGSCRKD